MLISQGLRNLIVDTAADIAHNNAISVSLNAVPHTPDVFESILLLVVDSVPMRPFNFQFEPLPVRMVLPLPASDSEEVLFVCPETISPSSSPPEPSL